jgi:hypothetical protein
MQIEDIHGAVPGLIRTKRGVRITGATQYVRFAYCVPLKRNLDIYEAQNAYFEQSKPRISLRFQCPDDDCRLALKPKITAVNYDKIISDEDVGKKAPHFRWNPFVEHIEDCGLVARYVARMADPTPVGRKKRDTFDEEEIPVVETFELRDEIDATDASEFDVPRQRERDVIPYAPSTHSVERGTPSSTLLLQPVVVSYHRLCATRLAGDTLLTISEQSKSYLAWFKRIQDYRWPTPLIFHGGARLKRGKIGAWFVEYMDSIIVDGVQDNPTLVIRDAELQAFSRRGVLKAILAAIASASGAYARCYFFGKFYLKDGRIRADFGGDLGRVYVVPRRLGQSTTLANSL